MPPARSIHAGGTRGRSGHRCSNSGELTTLGVVLDWGVGPDTKQRIQTKLEGLLYRFRYTTMRTFGRDEIEFSMRVFDLFGRRFFSLRRLLFVVSVYVTLALLFGIVLPIDHDPIPEIASAREGMAPFLMIGSAILFAFSITFTIWISTLSLRLAGGPTFIGTVVLLIVHLALFIVWRPLTFTALGMALVIVYALLDEGPIVLDIRGLLQRLLDALIPYSWLISRTQRKN